MNFFIDSYNICRVCRINLNYTEQIIADYLEEDVMGGDYTVNLLIDCILKIQKNEIEKWQGTGNAHTISIFKDKIHIFNEFTEMEVVINDVEYFLSILYKWRELVLSRKDI